MPAVNRSVSAVAISDPIELDWKRLPFAVGFGITLSAGANLTYKVQHTFDAPLDANAVWFDHEFVVAKTANEDGNYAFPVQGMRLNVTAHVAGTATLKTLQGGIR